MTIRTNRPAFGANVLLSVLALGLASVPVRGADVAAPPVRVLLTYGGHGFEQAPFFKMFDELPGIVVTRAPLPQSADMLTPALRDSQDVIVMYDMVRDITATQRQSFLALLEAGIGVVALHHNLGAYRDWPEYRKIIGGKWIHKPEVIDGVSYAASTFSHGEDIPVTIADPAHDITRGLWSFSIHDETYGGFYCSPEVHLLLKTDHPKNSPQIAWTTHYGKSPVFYLMLGHDSKAWANPVYPKLLGRGIRWAAETARIMQKPPAPPRLKAESEDWQPLFDGRTLDGWKPIDFGGQGKVWVTNDELRIGMGQPFTGVRWTNNVFRTDYEIELEARRTKGNDFFCGLTVPVGESYCSLIVGGWGGGVIGISSIDGFDASENETGGYYELHDNQWYHVRLRVRPFRLTAWLDGKQLFEQDIDGRQIGLRAGEIEECVPMGLATWYTEGALRNFRIRKLPSQD